MLVGVHDPKGLITHQVEAHVGKDLLRLPSEPAIGHESDGDKLAASLTYKELLLSRSSVVIVQASDIESLSILTGALRRLLEGSLRGVMAVGPIPLQQFINAAKFDGTEEVLRECIADGRFSHTDEFDDEALHAFLANVGQRSGDLWSMLPLHVQHVIESGNCQNTIAKYYVLEP